MKLSYFFSQSGLIRTDNGEFFIEPLEKGQQDVEVKGRVHVVYRRLAIKKEAGQERQDLHNEGGSETLLMSVETSNVVYSDVCMFWLCVHTWLCCTESIHLSSIEEPLLALTGQEEVPSLRAHTQFTLI